jgi:hypothetical protein
MNSWRRHSYQPRPDAGPVTDGISEGSLVRNQLCPHAGQSVAGEPRRGVSTGCQESAHASDLAAFAEVRLVSDTAGGRLDSRIRGGRSQVTLLKPTGGEADTQASDGVRDRGHTLQISHFWSESSGAHPGQTRVNRCACPGRVYASGPVWARANFA